MIEKETVNVNGKEITVYKVTVKDVWGEEHVETGITYSAFNELLPDGYDSDRKKYSEEFSFDASLDFYIPDEISVLSDADIVTYLNKRYGDDDRVFIKGQTYEDYWKEIDWLADEINRLKKQLCIVEQKMISILQFKMGDIVEYNGSHYYVAVLDLYKGVAMLRNIRPSKDFLIIDLPHNGLLKKVDNAETTD